MRILLIEKDDQYSNAGFIKNTASNNDCGLTLCFVEFWQIPIQHQKFNIQN